MRHGIFRKPALGGHVTYLLAAYNDGALDADAARHVRRHLERCERCRRAQQTLARASAMITDAQLVPAPNTLWERVEANLARHPIVRTPGRQRQMHLSLAASLGMVALLAGVMLARQTRLHPDHRPIPNVQTVSWRVERLAGTPIIGATRITQRGRLGVGESLTTDGRSRARVEVADIGQVEIAPNSHIRLLETRTNLHRLSLDRGELSARVVAPPRLFFVDTPSARAVDLGCAYTLTVDSQGNSRLQVTSGHVALVLNNKETEVPAGALCVTRRGVGTGTPFYGDASPTFQAALTRYDFEHGGAEALQTIVRAARAEDSLTLWSLFNSVSPELRPMVVDGLLRHAAFPRGVTRNGVLRLDPQMLARWKERIDD